MGFDADVTAGPPCRAVFYAATLAENFEARATMLVKILPHRWSSRRPADYIVLWTMKEDSWSSPRAMQAYEELCRMTHDALYPGDIEAGRR